MRYYNAIIYFMSLFRPSVYLGRLKTCWLRCYSFLFSVMKLPFLSTTLTFDVCWKKHLFCCIDSLLFYFRHTASHKMMKFPLKTGKKRCLFKGLELLKPSIYFCNLYIYFYLFIYLFIFCDQHFIQEASYSWGLSIPALEGNWGWGWPSFDTNFLPQFFNANFTWKLLFSIRRTWFTW